MIDPATSSVTNATAHPGATQRGLRGAHVLLIFIGFFLTIFAVNGVMVYEARSTFGGLETDDAYRKGLAYNSRLVEAETQNKLGWRDDVVHIPDRQLVRISMADHSGAPISGLAIKGEIGRPATDRFDRQLAFIESAPGNYEVDAKGLEPGWWILDVEARKSGDGAVLYEAKERVWIKP
jgi:nitrogen fixation protein FixH